MTEAFQSVSAFVVANPLLAGVALFGIVMALMRALANAGPVQTKKFSWTRMIHNLSGVGLAVMVILFLFSAVHRSQQSVATTDLQDGAVEQQAYQDRMTAAQVQIRRQTDPVIYGAGNAAPSRIQVIQMQPAAQQ